MPKKDWYEPLRALESRGRLAEWDGTLAGLHEARAAHQGQFFTPDAVARFVWRVAGLDRVKKDDYYKATVLDNSFGSGRLFQCADPDRHALYGIEQDAECVGPVREAVRKAGFDYHLELGRMEEFRLSGRIDVAVINPPFSLHLDSPHVEGFPCNAFGRYGPRSSAVSHKYAVAQALQWCDHVVAVVPRPFAREAREDAFFSERLRAVYHLPPGSFKEEGASVDVSVLAWGPRRYDGKKEPATEHRVADLDAPVEPLFEVKGGLHSPTLSHATAEEDGPAVTLPVTGDKLVWVAHSGRRIVLKFGCAVAQARVLNMVYQDHAGRQYHGKGFRMAAGVKYTGQGQLDLECYLAQDDPAAAFEGFLQKVRSLGFHPVADPGLHNYLRKRSRRTELLLAPLRHAVNLHDGGLDRWLAAQDKVRGVAREAFPTGDASHWTRGKVEAGETVELTRDGRDRLEWTYTHKQHWARMADDRLRERFLFPDFRPLPNDWTTVHEGLAASHPGLFAARMALARRLGLDKWCSWGYQLHDLVEVSLKRGNVIVGWDMGLGKARLAVSLCLLGRGKRNLIVVETHLLKEMLREFAALGLTRDQYQVIEKPAHLGSLKTVNLIAYSRLKAPVDRKKSARVTYAHRLRRRVHTLVADECLPSSALIETDRGLIPISRIVDEQLDVRVASFDHRTGTVEYRKVIAAQKKSLKREWVTLEYQGGYLCVTTNHPVWCEGRGYVAAGLISPGDVFYVRLHNSEATAGSVRYAAGGRLNHSAEAREVGPAARSAFGSAGGFSRLEVQRVTITGWHPTEGSCQPRLREKTVPLPDALHAWPAEYLPALLPQRPQGSEPVLAGGDYVPYCVGGVVHGRRQPGPEHHEDSHEWVYTSGSSLAQNVAEGTVACGERSTTVEEVLGTSLSASRSRPFSGSGQVVLDTRYDLQDDSFGRGSLLFHVRPTVHAAPSGDPHDQEGATVWHQRMPRQVVSDEISLQGLGAQESWCYDLEVDGNNNFFANGVLVHNCHLLRNPQTDQSRAVWQVSPKVRYALTGTPVANYPRDVLPVVQWAAGDGVAHQPYGRFRPFLQPSNLQDMSKAPRGVDRFRDLFVTLEWVTNEFAEDLRQGAKREVPRIKDVAAFRELMAPVLKRRVMEEPEVAAHVRTPRPVVAVTEVPWDTEHLAYYCKVCKNFVDWFREAMKSKYDLRQVGLIAILAKMQAVYDAANRPQHGAGGEPPYAAMTSKQRLALDRVQEWVRDGHKVIVLAHSPDVVEHLKPHLDRRGVGSVPFHGGVAVAGRVKRLDDQFRFGDVPVLLATKGVLQTGYNIHQADRVLFYDRSWTPKVEMQAAARVLRPQQQRQVLIEYLHLEGSIDTYQAQMVACKGDAIKAGLDWGADGLERDFLHIETILGRFVEDFEGKVGVKLRDLIDRGVKYA